MQTSITPDIGWIEDSNNQPPSIDIWYRRLNTTELLTDAFPDAPKNIFKTNRHTIWFTAEIDECFVGVVAAEITGADRWTHRSAYILPLFRDQGIYDELCECRADYIESFHKGREVMQYPETWYKGDDKENGRRDNQLIGYWPTPETTEFNWSVQEQHFRAIACTYGVEIQIVEKPSQIVIENRRPWISIEEYSEDRPGVPYNEFEFPEEAVYIVGNSDWRRASDVFEVDHIINVPTPGGFDHPLYGNQVAAIVFQQRLLQWPTGDCGKRLA